MGLRLGAQGEEISGPSVVITSHEITRTFHLTLSISLSAGLTIKYVVPGRAVTGGTAEFPLLFLLLITLTYINSSANSNS